MRIRIVGVCGSPRHANTEIMVREALEAAKIHDCVDTEYVSLAGKKISGCTNCRACIKAGKCVIKDDWAECFKPLIDPVPDGVVFGAPVYFFSINSQARAYMERCTSLLKSLYFPEARTKAPDWSRTVAAALTVGHDRNGGQEHAISDILNFFLTNGFLVAGGGLTGGYIGAMGWLMGNSSSTSVEGDEQLGLRSARVVGRRIAETAMILKRGSQTSMCGQGDGTID